MRMSHLLSTLALIAATSTTAHAQDAMKAKADSTKKGAMTKPDAMKHDGMAKTDAMKHDGMAKSDAMKKDGMKKDAMGKAPAKKDTIKR